MLIFCFDFIGQHLNVYPWLPGTCYVEQDGLKLIESCLLLPPELRALRLAVHGSWRAGFELCLY